jgi:hypothetical protein
MERMQEDMGAHGADREAGAIVVGDWGTINKGI